MYYCNGRCGGQRIRRNAFFYTGGNNAYHWCSTCFSDLKDDQAIRLLDCTLSKAEIARSKKKHQEEAEEPWVQCNDCNRWAHILCSLFNNRRNLGDDVEYVCPYCLIKRKEVKSEIMIPTAKKTRAEDLPHSVLSQVNRQYTIFIILFIFGTYSDERISFLRRRSPVGWKRHTKKCRTRQAF